MIQAIVFLPLIGAIVAGFFGRIIGHQVSEAFTSCLLVFAAIFSWLVFLPYVFGTGLEYKVSLFEWINSGSLSVAWSLRVDTLTAVMLVVVTTVSALVHIYSIGYMSDDPHRSRFFAYLSFFTFAMLALVTADNFVQMFFGWEGVGLASYLLIGFWYKKEAARAAAMKAFVVNRVGDFGFLLGIMGTFAVVGTLSFDDTFASLSKFDGVVFSLFGMQIDAITFVCFALFAGAMGKSAQFFLHTWLPDAMEGPTPVSALIHAATMVTAGVFMVARLSPMFELSQAATTFMIYIGAITAIFAASVGLVQNDIKRVIAFSTCSQLGYMFVALGVGAYSAGVFHLFTHAFFKALLFLGAGSVIHAMHHEQDMRKMGGLAKKIPFTYWTMIIGTLALTGVGIPGTMFGFAGFFSKDAIVEAAYAYGGLEGPFAYWMLVFAALFTSFYSWRLIHLTFHGTSRAETHTYENAHESPKVMLIPLAVLSVGSVLAGVLFYDLFFGHAEHIEHFFRGAVVVDATIIEAAHNVPSLVKWSATFAMLGGALVAWYFYIKNTNAPVTLAQEHGFLYKFLLNKWYFDELYDRVFVRPIRWFGRTVWLWFDDWLIDKTIVEGIGGRVKQVSDKAVQFQSGYLYHYAFVMIVGIAALITWAITAGGLLG